MPGSTVSSRLAPIFTNGGGGLERSPKPAVSQQLHGGAATLPHPPPRTPSPRPGRRHRSHFLLSPLGRPREGGSCHPSCRWRSRGTDWGRETWSGLPGSCPQGEPRRGLCVGVRRALGRFTEILHGIRRRLPCALICSGPRNHVAVEEPGGCSPSHLCCGGRCWCGPGAGCTLPPTPRFASHKLCDLGGVA